MQAQDTWALLKETLAAPAALAGVLQQELGGGRELLAKLFYLAPPVANCSLDTVRARARALVKASQRAVLGRRACPLS